MSHKNGGRHVGINAHAPNALQYLSLFDATFDHMTTCFVVNVSKQKGAEKR